MDADYKSEIRLCSRQIGYSALRVKQHLGMYRIPKTDRIFHCAESMVRYNMDTWSANPQSSVFIREPSLIYASITLSVHISH